MADENPSQAFDLGTLGQNVRRQQEGTAERDAYLERLRKQVKAGEYDVDSEALAEALLESAPDEILPDQRPDVEDAK